MIEKTESISSIADPTISLNSFPESAEKLLGMVTETIIPGEEKEANWNALTGLAKQPALTQMLGQIGDKLEETKADSTVKTSEIRGAATEKTSLPHLADNPLVQRELELRTQAFSELDTNLQDSGERENPLGQAGEFDAQIKDERPKGEGKTGGKSVDLSVGCAIEQERTKEDTFGVKDKGMGKLERSEKGERKIEEGGKRDPIVQTNIQSVPVMVVPDQVLNVQDVKAAGSGSFSERIIESLRVSALAVVEAIQLTPTLATTGKGEIRIELKNEILDGSVVRFDVKQGDLQIIIHPGTQDAGNVLERHLQTFQAQLAERVTAWRVNVGVSAWNPKTNGRETEREV